MTISRHAKPQQPHAPHNVLRKQAREGIAGLYHIVMDEMIQTAAEFSKAVARAHVQQRVEQHVGLAESPVTSNVDTTLLEHQVEGDRKRVASFLTKAVGCAHEDADGLIGTFLDAHTRVPETVDEG